MKSVPLKKYIILMLILVITVLVTLYLSNIYINRNKETSIFYNYANVITNNDFDVYITENPDTILYLGDKYDLNYEFFEKKFINKIEELNLKENLVYISTNNKFINKINKDYNVKLNINKLPIVLVFIDGKLYNYSYVDYLSDASSIINFEVFE